MGARWQLFRFVLVTFGELSRYRGGQGAAQGAAQRRRGRGSGAGGSAGAQDICFFCANIFVHFFFKEFTGKRESDAVTAQGI